LNDLIQSSSSSLNSSSPSSPPKPITIRNAVCVDYFGHLPTALLYSLENTLSLPRLCFHMIGSSIPPRLTLAAFNLSLVGITTEPTHLSPSSSSSSSSNPLGYQTTELQIPAEILPRMTPTLSPPPPESPEGTGSVFSSSLLNTSRRLILNYEMNESSVHLLPCKGLGIVSDVDPLQALVHLITSPELEMECASLLHLTRGPLQLPTSLMYNISGQVCAPYLCSENYGEGSASLSARTNMKRRSQNK
jgi:hypothetical protein